jgi:hypothetical protein
VIPVFGYKNHLGIDRRRGFIRSFTITDTAGHDGRQLGRPPTHSSYTTTWDVTRPVADGGCTDLPLSLSRGGVQAGLYGR